MFCNRKMFAMLHYLKKSKIKIGFFKCQIFFLLINRLRKKFLFGYKISPEVDQPLSTLGGLILGGFLALSPPQRAMDSLIRDLFAFGDSPPCDLLIQRKR